MFCTFFYFFSRLWTVPIFLYCKYIFWFFLMGNKIRHVYCGFFLWGTNKVYKSILQSYLFSEHVSRPYIVCLFVYLTFSGKHIYMDLPMQIDSEISLCFSSEYWRLDNTCQQTPGIYHYAFPHYWWHRPYLMLIQMVLCPCLICKK